MSIRRFDTREVDVDGEFVVEFEAVPEGTWVRYSDHAAELARVEKANALLRAECEAKQKKIDAAYDAFVHIAEYWNGSDNDRAVADALEVMRNSATDAAGILKGGES